MPLTSDNEITFEKTPKYFILREIPQRIKDMYEKENASVKLILSLCDPGSRAYSDFKFSILAKDSKFHVSITAQQKKANALNIRLFKLE